MNTAITCPSMQRALGEVVAARPRFTTFICTLLATVAAVANAQGQGTASELGDLSIEELMNESITSVARKEQRIANAPAAVQVLMAEDILRAGHTSIPEALRMVPGLSVARLDSHSWIIAARGFAAQWAGKLLVLIDGRTVYSPFFSGVVWSNQDLLLEDLDRIEVIRGPGATLWGANAVNGVINIITKAAKETQGGLATAGGGTEERNGAIRYGGQAGNAQYRTFLKYDDYAEFVDPDGNDLHDSWRTWRVGFRTDWQPGDDNSFTLQGDLYGGDRDVVDAFTSLTPPYLGTIPAEEKVSGAYMLGRWNRTRDDRSRWSLQVYYDWTKSQDLMLSIDQDTFDMEFQHQLDLGSRHAVVYGAGYRFTHTDYDDSFFLSYANDEDSTRLANVFIQDEITLIRDKLALSIGSKFEHNEFTGLEIQPSARVMWTPDRTHSLWASASRAVRTPNLSETGLRINHTVFDVDGPGPEVPRVLSIVPNADLQSETLMAYEAGYRVQPSTDLYVDIAAFVNVYDDLLTTESPGTVFETSPAPAHLAIVSREVNAMQGETYGVELAPSWQVTDWWKLAGGYTWLRMNLHSGIAGGVGEEQEGDSPRHQLHLRSFMQWPHNVTFDTATYYVDSLPNQGVASYVRLDVRFGWHPTGNLGVSIGGTNILDDGHAEFLSYAATPAEMQRSFYGKLTWRF